MSPKQTESQRIGAEAEAAFAAFVAANGGVWSPTSGSSDFGLDGRVELVDEVGSLVGAEFAVQIKGSRRLATTRAGTVIGRVRAETAAYWLSRLNPTLLVGYDCESRHLFAAWAHHVPRLVGAASTGHPKLKLRVRVPSAPLDAESWETLRSDVVTWHHAIMAELDYRPVRDVFFALYLQLSGATDLLIEIACWTSMRTTLPVADMLGDMGSEDAISRRLLHPPRIVESGIEEMATLAVLQGIATSVALFQERAENILPSDSALLPPLAELNRWLILILEQTGLRETDGLPGETRSEATDLGHGPGLRWVVVDFVGLTTGAIAALLAIRDYNHDLRRALSPITPPELFDHQVLDAFLKLTPAADLLARWTSLT